MFCTNPSHVPKLKQVSHLGVVTLVMASYGQLSLNPKLRIIYKKIQGTEGCDFCIGMKYFRPLQVTVSYLGTTRNEA
jgi:hypothetical protein